MECELCKSDLSFQWSDTHGVGACTTCGLPHTILHYEDKKLIDKDPEVAIQLDWLPIGKKYWEETKRRAFPAAYDFMRMRNGYSYSGATEEECELWEEWLDKHKDELPQESQ